MEKLGKFVKKMKNFACGKGREDEQREALIVNSMGGAVATRFTIDLCGHRSDLFLHFYFCNRFSLEFLS